MSPPYTSLAEAVRATVRPGDHLHFASTPSRSNAAIRELAWQFAERRPGFTLSTSGFHSTAHLLAALRLGRTYLSCFFGDNWPVPRPNPLYTRLAREGADLECWSLLTYVEALRAGALGHEWAVTRSLAGSELGEDLARRGKLRTLPGDGVREALHLVQAIRPDVTFVHAPFADEHGAVLFSPPYGEGFWSALGARRGVIATVERIVSTDFVARHPDAIKIPAANLLAVCVEPYGAHPQPLFVTPAFGEDDPGYVDDTEDYARWRTSAAAVNARPARLGEFPGGADPERLAGLRAQAARRLRCGDGTAEPWPRLRQSDRLVRLGAHAIAARVRARGTRTLLAGIGNAFAAARLAKDELALGGMHPPIMVETGLHDIHCGPGCHGFLLSHDHVASAQRLSSVEDVLGTLTCGAQNGCLGVIGAAQIDARGAVNSMRLADGTLLLGSGGANDIASSAEEVVVLATCDVSRLVQKVDHVTSPGHRVRLVVTDRCILERDDPQSTRWRLGTVVVEDGATLSSAVLDVTRVCRWELDTSMVRPIAESDLLRGSWYRPVSAIA